MSEFCLSAFADEASAELPLQVAALKRNGIGCLEIRNVNGKNVSSLTATEVKEISRILSAEGISVPTVGSPIGKYALDADFLPEQERFLQTVETAHLLGAEKIRIFSFFKNDSVAPDAARETVFLRLRWFAEHSEGLTLCHENEKGIYGDNPDFCAAISREIPAVRAIFDPANYVQCGQDTRLCWEKMGAFVSYFHLKDATADGVVVPCGEGIGNVKELFGKFRSAGGTFATVEPHLFEFSAKKQLEKNSSAFCGNRYESADEAFDAAVRAVRAFL